MFLRNLLLVTGGVAGFVSAGTVFKPGVQLFEFAKYQGRSQTISLQDGVCTTLYNLPYSHGSLKMLSGGMECALYAMYDCTDDPLNPKSKFRHSPFDNTDKQLPDWLDYSRLHDSDLVELQDTIPAQAIICRSFVNNLLQKDSSSNNKHVPNDGWHEPGEHWGNL